MRIRSIELKSVCINGPGQNTYVQHVHLAGGHCTVEDRIREPEGLEWVAVNRIEKMIPHEEEEKIFEAFALFAKNAYEWDTSNAKGMWYLCLVDEEECLYTAVGCFVKKPFKGINTNPSEVLRKFTGIDLIIGLYPKDERIIKKYAVY